jgi:hypothetical protein
LTKSASSSSVSLVELFLPHLAVAFGFAPSFSDPKALSFSVDMLFMPKFGPTLSTELLGILRGNVNLNGLFDRFSDFTQTELPMDPITFEVFNIDSYLSEIQFSLNLAPSVSYAAPNFRASDLFDALFPTSIPTTKSFGLFVKKEILSKIRDAIGGLFDARVEISTIGFTVDEASFGENGFKIGEYSEFNNRLFPPMIDVDALQVSIYHLC